MDDDGAPPPHAVLVLGMPHNAALYEQDVEAGYKMEMA
jgi:hypothetical protein